MKHLTKDTLRTYWQHAKKYPWLMIGMVTGIFGFISFGTYAPFWYKRFFDLLAGGTNQDVSTFYHVIVVIVFINMSEWAFYRLGDFMMIRFEPRVMRDLKNTCYRYLQQHSSGYFANNFGGSLVRKVNRYARSFEDIVDILYWHIGGTALRIIVIIFAVAFWNWSIAVVIAVWAVLYVIGSIWIARSQIKYDKVAADKDTVTTGHLADTITNNINIKLFSAYSLENKSFNEHTQTHAQLLEKSWTITSITDAAQALLMIILEFIVFYIAIGFWAGGTFTIGDFALIQAYVIQLFNVLWGLGRSIRKMYTSLADADEMTEVLLTEHEVQDSENASALVVDKGGVEFKNISFSYVDGIQIFKGFNLNIAPGERIALVGASGSGKSSLIKLLFRFVDIQGGTIKIDGTDIRDVTQDSLRHALSLVPQDPILFHRSLLENIRYGNPKATNKQVVKASKLANCHEFISSFPDQYKTLVGERGVKLSGGERQRVAIARAILKNAPILVLDEATSSLDSESEHLIQDALQKLMKDKTTIVIAHRLSTIMQMDRIIVMDGGKIVEQGTHAELSNKKQGKYKKLWDIQVGGFIN